MRAHRGRVRKHAGFTLVELVVVVMILGILAAVAAPKLMGTSQTATENSVKHTLGVVRDAIERYAAENGGQLPPGTNLPLELKPYLRGDFPTNPLKSTTTVGTDSATNDNRPEATGSQAWLYKPYNGDFICNSSESTSVAGVNFDDL